MSKAEQGLGVPIKVLCGTHGNEALGPKLHEHLEREPMSGVQSRIAHPEAVKRGVRYLGQAGQLQGHYPGDPFGDPEDRAAWKNMRWLGNDAGSENTLVLDIHNNVMPGLTYFSVGRRALKASMVAAWILGYDKCNVMPHDPFRVTVPNATLIEQATPARADEAVAAQKLYEGLGELAFHDAATLGSLYDEMAANVQFYTMREILSRDSDGALVEWLPALEEIGVGDMFTPIALTDELREALDVPDGAEALYSYWDHHNMSPEQPDLGRTRDGVPRRLAAAGYFLPIDSPTVDGNWVWFADELGTE